MGGSISVPHIIYLEGIPGASKTSQGRLLAANDPRVKFFAEPMEEWTLFEKMCEDPARFTASAQTQIILSVFQTTCKAIQAARDDPDAIVVMERSLADPSLFSKQSLSVGNITTDEYTSLCLLANQFIALLPSHSFSVLYLTASAETMLKRVENRNRPGESRLDMKYMTYMNELHDTFYNQDRDNVFQLSTEGKTVDAVHHEVKNLLSDLTQANSAFSPRINELDVLSPVLKLAEATRLNLIEKAEQEFFEKSSRKKRAATASTSGSRHCGLADDFLLLRAAKRSKKPTIDLYTSQDETLQIAKRRLLIFLRLLDVCTPWAKAQFSENEAMLRRMTASHMKLIVGTKAFSEYQSEIFQYVKDVEGPSIRSLQNLVWITNRQQGKTSTLSKFLAVLSLLSPHGGTLCCVYSTSLDRAQEVTRAAKKYLYFYQTDPGVQAIFKEYELGPVVFTTDNERTYSIKSLFNDVTNTVQARPKNPDSCRGDAPASCLFDEVGFVSEAFWFNFAYPLLQVTGRIFLLTTTPAPLNSFFDTFSKTVQKQNAEGNIFFYLINHSLVCERCWERNVPAKCSHLLYLVPPWKSILRFHHLKRLVPSKQQSNFETEVYGAIRRQSSSFFPEKVLNAIFNSKRRFSCNTFEMGQRPTIYIGIDPPSHQVSSIGLAAIVYSTTGQVLIVGMSEVEIKSCDSVQIQMIVSTFTEKTIVHILESRKISAPSIRVVPVVECNNNDVLSLSITKTIRQVSAVYGCTNIMPFTRQYFATNITPDIGVLTTQASKHASIQALYGLFLDNRIGVDQRMSVVGAVHMKQYTNPIRDEVVSTLIDSLKAFHETEKGEVTGKTSSTNDDLAMALLLAVYWSHTIKAVSALDTDIMLDK